MMNILTILTGGTIGSIEKDRVINVGKDVCDITERYSRAFPDDVCFETLSLFNILSENISVDYWNTLIAAVSRQRHNYDGIIITHGSDTLSYTAAVLGICLCGIEIPVVITAADYPLDNPKSNGFMNFCAGVELIKNGGFKGVFVSYGTTSLANIHLATRLCEADRFTDKFTDFSGLPYAVFSGGELSCIKGRFNPETGVLCKKINPLFDKIPPLERCVSIITPYPGLDYSAISLSGSTKAVLHLTYHSGTACTAGDNSAMALLKKCRESGVDFYLCSLKERESCYATTRVLVENGAVPMYNISREAAYAKLTLIYSAGIKNPAQMAKTNCFFEHIMPD